MEEEHIDPHSELIEGIENPASENSPFQQSKIVTKKMALFLGGCGLLIIFSGMFIFQLLLSNNRESQIQDLKWGFIHLSPFFVPLSKDKKEDRFISVTVVLQVLEGEEEKIKGNITGLRSIIYNLLHNEGIEEISGKEKKERLKGKIMRALNRNFNGLNVKSVFITHFLIL
jgi:flagellar basal body-associated protein FliL